jgi:hypothetical protein
MGVTGVLLNPVQCLCDTLLSPDDQNNNMKNNANHNWRGDIEHKPGGYVQGSLALSAMGY